MAPKSCSSPREDLGGETRVQALAKLEGRRHRPKTLPARKTLAFQNPTMGMTTAAGAQWVNASEEPPDMPDWDQWLLDKFVHEHESEEQKCEPSDADSASGALSTGLGEAATWRQRIGKDPAASPRKSPTYRGRRRQLLAAPQGQCVSPGTGLAGGSWQARANTLARIAALGPCFPSSKATGARGYVHLNVVLGRPPPADPKPAQFFGPKTRGHVPA